MAGQTLTVVKHGQVLNIDETIKAIRMALDNCYASNPNLSISEVYVGIAGHHIKSLQTRGDIVRQSTENEITQKEIDQLVADQYKTYIPAGDQIIDVIPQEFAVDNFQNIISPIGYGGVKVGANFHIITGDKNAIKNISRAVEKRRIANERSCITTARLCSSCDGSGRPRSGRSHCRYWWRNHRPGCVL
ncbi:MAG: cell division protein FtsA [Puia sp.]